MTAGGRGRSGQRARGRSELGSGGQQRLRRWIHAKEEGDRRMGSQGGRRRTRRGRGRSRRRGSRRNRRRQKEEDDLDPVVRRCPGSIWTCRRRGRRRGSRGTHYLGVGTTVAATMTTASAVTARAPSLFSSRGRVGAMGNGRESDEHKLEFSRDLFVGSERQRGGHPWPWRHGCVTRTPSVSCSGRWRKSQLGWAKSTMVINDPVAQQFSKAIF